MNWSSTPATGIFGTHDMRVTSRTFPPTQGLAHVVQQFWLVNWVAPPRASGQVVFIARPEVKLALWRGRLTLCGIQRDRRTLQVSGEGRVFGLDLHPGAATALFGRAVSDGTNRARPVETVWGADMLRALAAGSGAADARTLIEVAERSLRARVPEQEHGPPLIDRIVRKLKEARTARISEICDEFYVSVRSLQRLFQQNLGVSPKWLMCQYRLHAAAERLEGEPPARHTDIASDLGYFDGSHFTRDFARSVGITPAAYAQACLRSTVRPAFPVRHGEFIPYASIGSGPT